ncbi:phage tail protein [Brevibacillus laterosporus]|uniref:phage tail protein n=1 Tax=Brevibacillus laterosporus TaxID=1465 RepID=UPI003D1D2A17
MGQIGSYGSLVFEVSIDKMRPISDLSRSAASRWATHERFGQKPRSEFLGPSLDTIGFTMRFDVRYGMNPKAEMDQLLDWCRSGKAETLIIGGTPFGRDQWVITNIVQKMPVIDGQGRVLVGTADVTLEEYMRE